MATSISMEVLSNGNSRYRSRKFYDIDSVSTSLEDQNDKYYDTCKSNKHDNLFSYINDNVIGKNKCLSGPFGYQKGKYFSALISEQVR